MEKNLGLQNHNKKTMFSKRFFLMKTPVIGWTLFLLAPTTAKPY
jgi:hypothetical protein